MKFKSLMMAGIAAALLVAPPVTAQPFVSVPNAALPEMPKQTNVTGKRINRIIDMWLKNQPVYYLQVEASGFGDGKGETSYDMGKRLSATITRPQ